MTTDKIRAISADCINSLMAQWDRNAKGDRFVIFLIRDRNSDNIIFMG
ncbi:MAG: hypothetical protein J7647_27995 [Cyanobacteria bacterium SBLK]|nr:hypothetical protein [Cyanobacteria bacterium SBLK]